MLRKPLLAMGFCVVFLQATAVIADEGSSVKFTDVVFKKVWRKIVILPGISGSFISVVIKE